jgi:putative heme-binding domain-containing protein
VSRTLAALGGEKEMVAALNTQINVDSRIEDDLHYLTILGQVKGEWTVWDTQHVVNWLLNLEEKIARDRIPRDQNWPLRLEEILEALGRANPEIAEGLLSHPKFGRPEHLLFIKPLGISPAVAAIEFLKAAKNDPNYAWTPGLIRLLDSLSLTITRPVLIRLWERQHLRDTILRLLASDPEPGDQPKFLIGFASLDSEVVQSCARALTKLSPSPGPTELIAALKALRRLTPEDKTTREAIVSLLRKRSGEAFAPDPKLWTDWATKKYPDIVKLLATNDGFDPVAWKRRELGIPWDKGDVPRGRLVFTKATCASCHDGGRAMGPSLLGVAKRFSRDDLLTAILEPSKDVSPRYRPTRLTTLDDKVYVGMIVYEATDGVILQTNPDTVIRIAGDNIAAKRTVDISLMPAGLLDKLTDPEVADLFAYLRLQDK